MEDMIGRAHNNFEHDAVFLQGVQHEVGDFRRKCMIQGHDANSQDLYTHAELEEVLQKRSGRQVTLALANPSRRFGLTSSLWSLSLKAVSHIRKSDSRNVRHIKCLRPVSLVSDMAHVVDGLWIGRNRLLLEHMAGPGQVGGVSSPQFLVLALVLLTELRSFQGLPLYFAILDLRWAFDVALLPCMKLACAQAGVAGVDWLLLDDVMDMDTQCVQLHGLLSEVFTLGCGIAQGRHFSVHVFNGLLSWLKVEIDKALPRGVRAWMPPQIARALAHHGLLDTPADLVSCPSPVSLKQVTCYLQTHLSQQVFDEALR